MATFDQLPAEQRAIIELVVQRGRSYQSLADVLEMPPQRVRELAREALTALSPVTAARVDPEWRGQLADYLLGQQAGPESTATRGHLRRSEPARAWAMSLLDSLDGLYGNGDRPLVPDADEAPPRERERDRRGRRARAQAADSDGGERAAVAQAPPREPEPEPQPKPEPEPEPPRRERPARVEEPVAEREERRARAALSPEAQRALRRRRLGAVAGGLLVAAAVGVGVAALAGAFSGSSKHPKTSQSTGGARIVGDIPLQPVDNSGDQGIAVIGLRGTQRQLLVQAKVKPAANGYAYEVWLYNSPNDLVSLGAQVPDAQGNYLGSGPLPANYARYKYIDISYEKVGRTTAHNGPSVLRGAFAAIQAPPPTSAGASSSVPGAGGSSAVPGAGGSSGLPGAGGSSAAPGAGGTPTPAP